MAHSLSPCWYMLVHAIALSRLHSLSFTRASFPRLSLVHASTYTTFTRASQYTLRSCTTAAVRVEHRPPRTHSRVHPFTVILSMFKNKLHRRVERGGSKDHRFVNDITHAKPPPLVYNCTHVLSCPAQGRPRRPAKAPLPPVPPLLKTPIMKRMFTHEPQGVHK